jgi:hypothetical protein
MTEIHRIGSQSYSPLDHDIVLSRVRTTGISEMQFTHGRVVFRVIDVGGQRWNDKHVHDNVSAITI